MDVERFRTVETFAARSHAFLARDEAEHNLLLGLLGRLVDDPGFYGDPDLCLAVTSTGGNVAGVALQTPPYNLALSRFQDTAAVDALAAALHADGRSFPGVIGPVTPSGRFAERFAALAGLEAGVEVEQRIYEATHAIAPAGVPGAFRPYRGDDRALIVEWAGAFMTEALPDATPPHADGFLERRLAEPRGGIVLWEDEGRPVSFAGYGGETPNGIRVGPVYTPPQLRRRGYATALVAELTARLLSGGRRFCFLYTDLANPTSNSIYRRIGYQPVADVTQWRFAPS